MINVLLTCAGRRNYLIRYFREALHGRGRVVAVDANRQTPALQEADRGFVLPPVQHPDYLNRLLDLCREQEIGLVVPLNDLELPVLAQARQQFRRAGIQVAVSSPDVVTRCFDKWEMFFFLDSQGLPVPRTFTRLEDVRQVLWRQTLAFPVVVKPRWGTASIGVHRPTDDTELELTYRLARKQVERSIIAEVSARDPSHCVLIQEFLHGEEYGLDVINDLEGRYVTTLVRRKLGMRAGETDRAVTCHDPELEALGERIGRLLGHVGNLDCDVIRGPESFGILDMNPRFGGGYPFVHVAGANLPAALIAWATGREPEPAWLRCQPGVTSCKYDSLLVVPDSPRVSW